MHAARLDKSERLRRVLDLLSDGKPRTTRDIVEGAQVCAVNSCISELRANGHQIACQRQGDVWWYWIEKTSSTASHAA